MPWEKPFGIHQEGSPVWAALCFARADSSNAKYPVREKHAVLAMVRAPQPEVEGIVCALLQSNGWREPEIKNLKLLDQPFHSDDPIMRACHESAIKEDGGFVVYTDPIDEA